MPPINFTKCPERPEVDTKTQLEDAANIIQSMGIRACSTDNTNISGSIAASIPFASGSATFQANHTATLGCENLNVIASNYRNTQNNISCILNQSENIVKVVTTALNNISITASGDGSVVDMQCANGLNINQGIEIKSVTNFSVSDQDTAAITSQISSLAQQTASVMNKDTSGLGADTHGSKNIQQQLQNIQQANLTEQVKQAVRDISISTSGQNMLTIEAKGKNSKVIISGSNCNINQYIVLDVAASMIMNNVMNSTFSGVVQAINKQDAKFENVEDRKGVGNTFDSMYNWLTATQIGPILIIAAAIVGIVFIILIFKFALGGGTKGMVKGMADDAIKGASEAVNSPQAQALLQQGTQALGNMAQQTTGNLGNMMKQIPK